MSFRTCSCRMPAPWCRRQAHQGGTKTRRYTEGPSVPPWCGFGNAFKLAPDQLHTVPQRHADECVGAGAAPGAFVQGGIAVGEPLQGRVVEVERGSPVRYRHGDGELETRERSPEG